MRITERVRFRDAAAATLLFRLRLQHAADIRYDAASPLWYAMIWYYYWWLSFHYDTIWYDIDAAMRAARRYTAALLLCAICWCALLIALMMRAADILMPLLIFRAFAYAFDADAYYASAFFRLICYALCYATRYDMLWCYAFATMMLDMLRRCCCFAADILLWWWRFAISSLFSAYAMLSLCRDFDAFSSPW